MKVRNGTLKTAGRMVFGALLCIGVYFVSRHFAGTLQYFQALSAVAVLQLVLAVSLIIVAASVYGAIWAWMVGRFAGSSGIGIPDMRVFAYSWLGRYIPGTLPYHAARIVMAERHGRGNRMVATSIGYESLLQVSSLALVGLVAMLLAVRYDTGDTSTYLFVSLPLATLPLLLQPRVMCPLFNKVLAFMGREPLSPEFFLRARENFGVVASYCLWACFQRPRFLLCYPSLGSGRRC